MVTQESTKREVIRLWLFELKSPRDIEQEIGVPKSTAHTIIKEFREKTPNIDQFREIWKQVKPLDVSVADTVRGITRRRTSMMNLI